MVYPYRIQYRAISSANYGTFHFLLVRLVAGSCRSFPQDSSDMAMGPFSITQPNPIHEFMDPTQPNIEQQRNVFIVAKHVTNLL